MIYLIVDWTNDLCTIGFTLDPKKSFREAQKGKLEHISLIALKEGTEDEANALKLKFGVFDFKNHVWFDYDEDVAEYFNVVGPDLYIYPAMYDIFNSSSDYTMRVYGYLLRDYSRGFSFSLGALKKRVAEKCNCSLKDVNDSLTTLLTKKCIFKEGKDLYRLNVEFAYNGDITYRTLLLSPMVDVD